MEKNTSKILEVTDGLPHEGLEPEAGTTTKDDHLFWDFAHATIDALTQCQRSQQRLLATVPENADELRERRQCPDILV